MNLLKFTTPLIIAHRGFKSKYPENTLSSFEAAIQCGAQMIELDVTLTKDRELIVIHDDTLDRTTNGKGAVNNFSLKELQKLDAGSWFDPKFSDQKLPTLKAVLSLSKNKTFVNIEIKASAYEPANPADAIENRIYDLVSEMGMSKQVLISSFEKNILYNMRKLDSDILLSFLTEYPISHHVVDILKDIHAFSWNQDLRYLKRSDVETMHDEGFKVIVFTVNTRDEVKKCLDMNIDGFFTDYPDMSITHE